MNKNVENVEMLDINTAINKYLNNEINENELIKHIGGETWGKIKNLISQANNGEIDFNTLYEKLAYIGLSIDTIVKLLENLNILNIKPNKIDFYFIFKLTLHENLLKINENKNTPKP